MLTGNFKEFITFTIIIIIHESGHVLAGLYYKWNIEKIILLPFGALTLFKEKLNKPLFEEFIILIMGPLFQITGVFILFNHNTGVINYSNIILFFNLLPIFPLDGAKLLNIILNKFLSFKKSHLITLYISVLIIAFIILQVKFSLILIFTMFFILLKVLEEIKNHKAIFNKFLLERYLYNFNFKKKKKITNIKQMKRDYKHIFYRNNKYVSERQVLAKLFDNKRNL